MTPAASTGIKLAVAGFGGTSGSGPQINGTPISGSWWQAGTGSGDSWAADSVIHFRGSTNNKLTKSTTSASLKQNGS
jgi:hypothetical protein